MNTDFSQYSNSEFLALKKREGSQAQKHLYFTNNHQNRVVKSFGKRCFVIIVADFKSYIIK